MYKNGLKDNTLYDEWVSEWMSEGWLDSKEWPDYGLLYCLHKIATLGRQIAFQFPPFVKTKLKLS